MGNRFRPLITVFPLTLLMFVSSFLVVRVYAGTYYVSASGSGATCSSSSPCSLSRISIAGVVKPGDTWILQNGTYRNPALTIKCDAGVSNGTAQNPITIIAQNERQAFLQSDGTDTPLIISNCSYWTIQGLRISNADKQTTNEFAGGAVLLFDVYNFTFRRNLLQYNNRYLNGALLAIETAAYNSLFEENEFYDYHRNGFGIGGSGNVIRRNYINSRNRADIPGGYPSGPPDRGDSGFQCYPCSNNIFENNIAEGAGAGYGVAALGDASNNRFYGNISLNNNSGWVLDARGNDPSMMPRSNYQTNFVTVGNNNTGVYGIYSRASKDTRCDNCTIMNHAGGFAADSPTGDGYGDKNFSVYSTNTLVTNNNGYLGYGLYIMLSFGSWNYSIDRMNSYGQGVNFSPALGGPNITNSESVNPNMGGCYLWVPASSPMNAAGAGGADIGANVLYRYQGGVLTNQPLWDPTSGRFPGGAVIAGVNDIASSSLFDVNKRLNVNTNGCAFPAGYGSSSTSVFPGPSNLVLNP